MKILKQALKQPKQKEPNVQYVGKLLRKLVQEKLAQNILNDC